VTDNHSFHSYFFSEGISNSFDGKGVRAYEPSITENLRNKKLVKCTSIATVLLGVLLLVSLITT